MSDIKTKPVTAEYADGYERIFGKKEIVRGRWIQDPTTGEMISAEEYNAPTSEEARVAPIMVDRFYEGARATDGTDIGSRKKHRDYMRRNGLTTVDDYKNTWAEAAKERERIRTGEADRKERRELIGKLAYEVMEKKNGRR